jgi:hypothetical protein
MTTGGNSDLGLPVSLHQALTIRLCIVRAWRLYLGLRVLIDHPLESVYAGLELA